MPCGARVRRDAPNSLRSNMRRIFFRLTLRSSAATRLIHVKVKSRFSGRTRPTHKLPACVHRLPRSPAFEPPFSAEGAQPSGKLKRRKRTTSTSMIQKACPLPVLSAFFWPLFCRKTPIVITSCHHKRYLASAWQSQAAKRL